MRRAQGNCTVSVPLENTSNSSNSSNRSVSPAIPDWAAEAVSVASGLAQGARAAALAGDHRRASELRADYDRLWDDIEAQALALAGLEAQPVGLLVPCPALPGST